MLVADGKLGGGQALSQLSVQIYGRRENAVARGHSL